MGYYLTVLDYTDMQKYVQVIGVWDDHDFGSNNGGGDLPSKDIMRDVFLDFIKEPLDSDRRLQTGTGTFYFFVSRLIQESSRTI